MKTDVELLNALRDAKAANAERWEASQAAERQWEARMDAEANRLRRW